MKGTMDAVMEVQHPTFGSIESEDVRSSASDMEAQHSVQDVPRVFNTRWSDQMFRDGLCALQCDRSGAVSEVSKGFLDMLGYRIEDVVRNQLAAILSGVEDRPSYLNRLNDMIERGWGIFECAFSQRSGLPIETLGFLHVNKDSEEGLPWLDWVLLDLTEIREEGRDISLALGMNAVRPISVARVHRFNNQVKVIASYLSYIQEKLDPIHPLQQFVDISRSMVHKAIRLTSDILHQRKPPEALIHLESFIKEGVSRVEH